MTKIISFYLPQFHPIPENNEWWGKGFTEWTNVAQTKPRFKGHHQPQIPADLGFYDLRLNETRVSQAELAKEYGIDGFCYYHYWFNGDQLLERPLTEVLKLNQPDFPFCICWANENWTRAWDGLERQVLIQQNYTSEDSREHFDVLIKIFQDKRYITIDGKPVLLIYRPDNIPSPLAYFTDWKRWAIETGYPGLYICAVKTGFSKSSDEELLELGFDAIVDFQPNRNDFPVASTMSQLIVDIFRKVLPQSIFQLLKSTVSAVNRVDYKALVEKALKKDWPGKYIKYPCVFPSWDNTARRKTPTIIQNDNPEYYGRWLDNSIKNVKRYRKEEQLVFINAWNEWAEGCHLEPDIKNGHAFLEETKRVIDKS